MAVVSSAQATVEEFGAASSECVRPQATGGSLPVFSLPRSASDVANYRCQSVLSSESDQDSVLNC